MVLPESVAALISRLERSGFQAFAVGGCVRDRLLGREPQDWDIATSATPDQTSACFGEPRVIGTGLRHGTTTVLWNGGAYEVTTFRADGAYTDHRRPDSVRFVSSLEQDLARRDFTINAMAMDRRGQVHDPFGGARDLASGLIRCVGDPWARFEEDALRILRALRFASAYGFSIDPLTASAMREKRGLLSCVSAERVDLELRRVLCGSGTSAVLNEFGDVLGAVVPEILPMIGFDQRSRHHDSDLWGHTVRSVAAIAPDPALRLAMLLHDAGKSECFTLDEAGEGHFYGHAAFSGRVAARVMARLKADRRTASRVTELVRLHDLPLEPEPRAIRRRLNQLGEPALRDLLRVQRADALAHAEASRREKLLLLGRCEQTLARLLAERACFSLRDLAIDGKDLMALGVPEGKRVGEALSWLLAQVLDGALPNERGALRSAARAHCAAFDGEM